MLECAVEMEASIRCVYCRAEIEAKWLVIVHEKQCAQRLDAKERLAALIRKREARLETNWPGDVVSSAQ